MATKQKMSGKRRLANTVYILLTITLVILYIVPSINQGLITDIGNFLGSFGFGGNRTKLSYQIDSANRACQITGIGRYNEPELLIPTEVLGNTVTSIGDSAFYYCAGITSLKVPSTVRVMGNYSFTTCHDLERVEIDHGIQQLGICTFMSCRKLKTVIIPASVTYIAQFTFYDCPELTSIHFGGTMAQWKNITYDTCWDQNNNGCVVYCSDGTIKS